MKNKRAALPHTQTKSFITNPSRNRFNVIPIGNKTRLMCPNFDK